MGVPITGERYAKASAAGKIVLHNAVDAVRTIRYGAHTVATLEAARKIEQGHRKRATVLYALNTEIERRKKREQRARKKP